MTRPYDAQHVSEYTVMHFLHQLQLEEKYVFGFEIIKQIEKDKSGKDPALDEEADKTEEIKEEPAEKEEDPKEEESEDVPSFGKTYEEKIKEEVINEDAQ